MSSQSPTPEYYRQCVQLGCQLHHSINTLIVEEANSVAACIALMNALHQVNALSELVAIPTQGEVKRLGHGWSSTVYMSDFAFRGAVGSLRRVLDIGITGEGLLGPKTYMVGSPGGKIRGANGKVLHKFKKVIDKQALHELGDRLGVALAGLPVVAPEEKPCIFALGENRFQAGGEFPRVVTDSESAVLEAFLEVPHGVLSKPDLVTKSGYPEAVTILRNLNKKFGEFQPHIHFPGKRGAGGYAVSIRKSN